jgi:hypothetical protein
MLSRSTPEEPNITLLPAGRPTPAPETKVAKRGTYGAKAHTRPAASHQLHKPLSKEVTTLTLSSRPNPDFLFAALARPAYAVFCKEDRMQLAASPAWTGNPGKRRDLRFPNGK